MLLCNGLYCSTHYYDHWIDEFSRDHRVVTFDYRGHGRSADPKDPAITLEMLVGDAQAVLETIDGPVILVGHSMGVRVALELAGRHEARVHGLVLLCGSVWGVGEGRVAEAAARAAPKILKLAEKAAPLSRALRDAVVRPSWMVSVGSLLGGLAHSTPKPPVEALVRNVRRLDIRTMTSIASSYAQHSARALLPGVQVPVLQIVGALDKLATPSHAHAVERELASCTTVVVEDCTHLAPIEAPDEVNVAVRRFVAALG